MCVTLIAAAINSLVIFAGTNTTANLMFTNANTLLTGPTFSDWIQGFGVAYGRTNGSFFQRMGDCSNLAPSFSQCRTSVPGCGQPMAFGWQAADVSNANLVNTGLGTNVASCGGNPGGFSQGSWMGNVDKVLVYGLLSAAALGPTPDLPPPSPPAPPAPSPTCGPLSSPPPVVQGLNNLTLGGGRYTVFVDKTLPGNAPWALLLSSPGWDYNWDYASPFWQSTMPINESALYAGGANITAGVMHNMFYSLPTFSSIRVSVTVSSVTRRQYVGRRDFFFNFSGARRFQLYV